MLKCEILGVYGFDHAIQGMRNPKNSWDKSDSYWTHIEDPETLETAPYQFNVGEADLNLMKNLFKAGTEHRKYDRMLQVYMTIESSLYWWKEFDTYKIGTVCNSCSTMHKIHDKEFTLDDFSHEHLSGLWLRNLESTIVMLNDAREEFLINKDKDYWWQMIQLLPSSYNQKRTVMMNYEVCARIIEQRKNHKLDEWHTLVDALMKLPYMEELIGGGQDE